MKAAKIIGGLLLFAVAVFIVVSIWAAKDKQDAEARLYAAYANYVNSLNIGSADSVSSVQIDSILNPLEKDSDEIEKIVWYSPSLPYSNHKVGCYIARDLQAKSLGLRFKISYISSHPLNIIGYKFQCDTTLYSYNAKVKTKIRDSGLIQEVSDAYVEAPEYGIIKALANCNSAKIRFLGYDRNEDFVISKEELAAIRDVYTKFRQAGGKISIQYSSFKGALTQ